MILISAHIGIQVKQQPINAQGISEHRRHVHRRVLRPSANVDAFTGDLLNHRISEPVQRFLERLCINVY